MPIRLVWLRPCNDLREVRIIADYLQYSITVSEPYKKDGGKEHREDDRRDGLCQYL